jgi:hypothetical protein
LGGAVFTVSAGVAWLDLTSLAQLRLVDSPALRVDPVADSVHQREVGQVVRRGEMTGPRYDDAKRVPIVRVLE